MPKIPSDRKRGFLVSGVHGLGNVWHRYLAIWSWTPVFHYPLTHPYKHQDVRVAQNNLRHDACWAVNLLVAVTFYLILELNRTGQGLFLAIAFSYAVWRAFDLAIQLLHGTLFGYRNLPGVRELMMLHRARRRLLLSLVHFAEIIFFYAVIYWWLALRHSSGFDKVVSNPAAALQLSFSTLTTVGYGTYAPVALGPLLIAILQSLTGLLLIAGFVAQMATMLKSIEPASELERAREGAEQPEGESISYTQYRVRHISPPLATAALILVIFYFARG